MKSINFTLYEKDGEIIFRNKKKLVKELLTTGWKEMEGTVRKKKKNRSAAQNRYWWACITEIADYTGHTKQQIHEIAKYKFCRAEMVDEKTGEIFEYLKSTTDYSTTEFSVLMDELRIWADETFGIKLPLAGEQLSMSELE